MGRHRTIEDTEILAIARKIFQERGHAASTREVADAAGISQGVLFQRFGSKDDLFFAAMLPSAPDIAYLVGEDDSASVGVEEHLREMARRMVTHFERTAPVTLHAVTHPSFQARSRARSYDPTRATGLLEAVAERLGSMRRRGALGHADDMAAAKTFLAVLHGVAIANAIGGSARGRKESLDPLIDVLWSGLEPRRTGRTTA